MIVDLSGYSTGVCDRLRQVTFCAAIAQIFGDPLLEVYEILTDEGPFSILDLFELEGFRLQRINYLPSNAIRMTPYNSEICEANVVLHKPVNLQLPIDQFLVIWKDTYKAIKPKISIYDLIRKEYDEVFNRGVVAIHVRLTDRVTRWPASGGITELQYEKFLKIKIPWIIKYANQNGYKVFLTSDNSDSDKGIRKLIRHQVGLIEYQKHWNTSGIRNTNGDEFLTDLFLLSKCKKIFTTTGGGVPLTAALIGGIENDSIHVWTDERLIDRFAIGVRRLLAYSRITKIIRLICKVLAK